MFCGLVLSVAIAAKYCKALKYKGISVEKRLFPTFNDFDLFVFISEAVSYKILWIKSSNFIRMNILRKRLLGTFLKKGRQYFFFFLENTLM